MLGSGRFPSNTQLGAELSSKVSPSAAAGIFECCFRAGGPDHPDAPEKLVEVQLWFVVGTGATSMHKDELAAALATKLARIAWSILANRKGLRHSPYRSDGTLNAHHFAKVCDWDLFNGTDRQTHPKSNDPNGSKEPVR